MLTVTDIKAKLTPEQWEKHKTEIEQIWEKHKAEAEQIERLEVAELEKLEKDRNQNPCEYFRPWKWQRRVLAAIPNCNILVVPAPNKIGKTAIMLNILNACALGYCPWAKSQYEKPGYIKVNGFWYALSPYHKKPPIRIRITGENWKAHIGAVIVPEFEQWAIKGSYRPTKNSEGVIDMITYNNDSYIQFMTYNADIDSYESWTGDIWAPDEPAPLAIFEATARGLATTGGKIFMFMSPLKEAWILNNLIEPQHKRYDVIVIDGLTFLDNENLVAEDTALLQRGGALAGDIEEYFRLLLDYDNRSKGEHVGLINAHLKKILDEYLFIEIVMKLQGLKRINDTEEENRDARFKGIFKHLIGRIFKTYKDFYHPNGHLVKPFKIDTDWPVICEIDWHHSIPPFLGFYAWDKENRIFIIKEIFVQMTGEQVAHEIIRQKKSNGWRLGKVYSDPLAKGDNKLHNNFDPTTEDTFSRMKKVLNKEGILIETTGLEKTQKWTGIDRIRDRLSTSSGVARLFVFDDCTYHRKAFKQWCYVNEQPSDEDDHPMETTYRAVLSKTKYTDLNLFKNYKSKPDRGVI